MPPQGTVEKLQRQLEQAEADKATLLDYIQDLQEAAAGGDAIAADATWAQLQAAQRQVRPARWLPSLSRISAMHHVIKAGCISVT